jgi:hypothetical protein
MMKIFMILVGLVVCGCASQPTELTQEERDIHVFYEEPKIAYENLDRIDTTSRASNAIDALDKVLRRAAELGADGVLVHSISNKGTVADSVDSFGTGGGRRVSLFQIQATAIRYVD